MRSRVGSAITIALTFSGVTVAGQLRTADTPRIRLDVQVVEIRTDPKGAVFVSLRLPDGRGVTSTCRDSLRVCRVPPRDNLSAEFDGNKVKLTWPVSIDGLVTQSQTFTIDAVLGKAPPPAESPAAPPATTLAVPSSLTASFDAVDARLPASLDASSWYGPADRYAFTLTRRQAITVVLDCPRCVGNLIVVRANGRVWKRAEDLPSFVSGILDAGDYTIWAAADSGIAGPYTLRVFDTDTASSTLVRPTFGGNKFIQTGSKTTRRNVDLRFEAESLVLSDPMLGWRAPSIGVIGLVPYATIETAEYVVDVPKKSDTNPRQFGAPSPREAHLLTIKTKDDRWVFELNAKNYRAVLDELERNAKIKIASFR